MSVPGGMKLYPPLPLSNPCNCCILEMPAWIKTNRLKASILFFLLLSFRFLNWLKFVYFFIADGIMHERAETIYLYRKGQFSVNNDNPVASAVTCNDSFDVAYGGARNTILRVPSGVSVTLVNGTDNGNNVNINTDCPVIFSNKIAAPAVGNITQMSIDLENLRIERKRRIRESRMRFFGC